jgi:hypothetical protein
MRSSARGSLFWLLLLLVLSPLQAQTLLPNPNLALRTFGEVNALVRQPDGGVIIGGSFSSVDGVQRANLARLRADGSLDPDWMPVTDGAVHALTVDGHGDVYAGGDFLQINGLPRMRLAKLRGSGDGAPDPAWNPSANLRVNVLAFDPITGAVFAGGGFTQIGGLPRSQLAKLATDGAGQVDAAWNPVQFRIIEVLAVVPGAIYVGGTGMYSGGFSPALAKYATAGAGARVEGWVAASTNPYSLAANPVSGELYVGDFNGRIGRLSGETGALTGSWTVETLRPGRVTALLFDAGSRILYAGSTFRMARLSDAGVVDTTWSPTLSGPIRALVAGPTGAILAGGSFSQAGEATRLSLASFDASGSLQPSPDVERAGYANVLARQPNGGVIVAGGFYKANGQTRRSLLRLASDGSLDPVWNPELDSGEVVTLAVDPNSGDVYAGGEFGLIGGQLRSNLAKLSGSGEGAVDPLWNPSPNRRVSAIVVDDAGAVFVGGSFRSLGERGNIGGEHRDHLAKLSGNGTGAADPDWNPSPSGQVDALAVDGTGGLLVGGVFNQIDGQASANFARLSVDGRGALDPMWVSSASSSVRGLTIDAAAGWVYVRGEFTTLGGVARAGLGRVSLQNGAVDEAWNPAPNNWVSGVELDAAGNVYAAGTFTEVGGLPRAYLARLAPSGSGGAEPRWNPRVSAPGLATLMVDPERPTVYAAGAFVSIAGQPRNGLAAIAAPVFTDGFEAPVP